MNDLSIKKVVNGLVKTLSILAIIIALFGLILAACLKIETVASKTLSLYPRYSLAMEGIKVFEEFKSDLKKMLYQVRIINAPSI